jgi:pimeloyl-ACP methyl ester carboxylesterase
MNPRRDEDELREGLSHNLIQLPDGRWTWKYDRRHYRYVSNEDRDRRRREIWSAAATVSCPVLVMRGAQSKVLNRANARALAAVFPNGRFVEIAAAGHNVQQDQPAALAGAIVSFLDPGPAG